MRLNSLISLVARPFRMCQRWACASAMMLALMSSASKAEVFQTPEMLHATLPLAKRMRIDLQLSEPRLCMQVDQPNIVMLGLAGGVIVAAINGGGRRSAEQSVAAMREALGDMPIEATLRAAIDARLDRSVFAAEYEVGVFPVRANGRPDRKLQTPGTHILVLTPAFCFDPDAEVLKFSIGAMLENRFFVDSRLRSKPQYNNTIEYAFEDEAISGAKDRDARMELWAQSLDRDRALHLLTESINGAVDQINDALRTRNDSVGDVEKRRYRGQGSRATGYVRREAEGRTWMRLRLSANEVSVGPLPPAPALAEPVQ